MYIPTIDISYDYKINRNSQLDDYVLSITIKYSYFTLASLIVILLVHLACHNIMMCIIVTICTYLC